MISKKITLSLLLLFLSITSRLYAQDQATPTSSKSRITLATPVKMDFRKQYNQTKSTSGGSLHYYDPDLIIAFGFSSFDTEIKDPEDTRIVTLTYDFLYPFMFDGWILELGIGFGTSEIVRDDDDYGEWDPGSTIQIFIKYAYQLTESFDVLMGIHRITGTIEKKSGSGEWDITATATTLGLGLTF